jgi:hypothetical protein
MLKMEMFKTPIWIHNPIAIASLAFVLSLTAYTFAQSQPTSLTLSTQFNPNPTELRGTAGGTTPVSRVTGQTTTPTGPCAGFANATPNHTIVLKSAFNSLSILVDSPQDTALVIRGPGGIWCNDDFQGKKPGVSGQWLPGKYDIWVSTYAKDRAAPYVIRFNSDRK